MKVFSHDLLSGHKVPVIQRKLVDSYIEFIRVQFLERLGTLSLKKLDVEDCSKQVNI
jgi:hypothetical protein